MPYWDDISRILPELPKEFTAADVVGRLPAHRANVIAVRRTLKQMCNYGFIRCIEKVKISGRNHYYLYTADPAHRPFDSIE